MQAAPGRPGHYAVGAAAGVQHLVTLSIVRIDRASGYGYHRARPAQGRAAPQRLLAGSDWPVCTVAATYARWWETLRQWAASLSAQEQAAIFGANAARVYHGLDPAV